LTVNKIVASGEKVNIFHLKNQVSAKEVTAKPRGGGQNTCKINELQKENTNTHMTQGAQSNCLL